MAYDQGAAYQPPSRHYYAQTQEEPPPAYSDYREQDAYDQYDQGHRQEYHQQSGSYDHGYTQSVNAEQYPAYSNGYHEEPSGQQQANGQHSPQRSDRNEDRPYDPRYQQRPQRGPPPSQGHHSSQRDPPPSGRPPPQGDPRGQPRHTAPPAEARRPQETHERRYPRAPRVNGNGQAPQQAQPPSHDPSRRPMAEWKAREKARFNKKALSPESLSLDNAFPMFPKKDRTGGPSTSAHRSEEQPRPATSGSQRPRASREQRRKNNGIDPGQVQPPPSRPDVTRHHTSPEVADGRQHANPQYRQEPQMYNRQYSDQRQPLNHAAASEDHPEQWPMASGQTPPQTQVEQRLPQQVNGHDPRPFPTTRAPQYQESYLPNNPPMEAQRPPKQRGPPIQHIDTSQARHEQRPVYMDHQPLSPANVPPRPFTSQGARPPVSQQVTSPPFQPSQSVTPQDGYGAPRPWAHDSHPRSGSLGDIYDDYNTTPPKPLSRVPTSRDEEIEAEMPDFDSAAPSQTSHLHKRNQTVEKHFNSIPAAATPPPMPGMQPIRPDLLPQSQSAHNLGYAQQQYSQPDRVAPGPAYGSRGPPRRGTNDPYSGGSTPVSAPSRQYDIPYRNSPQQNSAYQQGAPLPPPQAPFAHEPPMRRSMDDARQRSQRHAPSQQQRFYQDGQPAPNQYPPQQRPDFERNATAQTAWSGHGQERVGSAPPPQQSRRQPMGPPTGVPLTQQRSAPEQDARPSHPDALPHHPVPVRAGHMPGGAPQPSKPPPVRNYNGSGPSQSAPSHQRQASIDDFAQPVTHEELDRLRAAVDATPNSQKQSLILVKKLVEAASVLAPENGRADAKTTFKNRERYVNEAHKRLKKLVAAGYPDAQFYLADCHGQGTLGLEVDTKEAFKLYQAAAKAGHAQAAYRTAVCCEMGPEEGGGTSRDFPKAVQWYRRAATLGDPAAMYKLGAVLLKGLLGQQQNVAESVIWLKRGAERADRDNPHALHELGGLYESTNTNPEVRNNVVADDAYARELFQQAAGLGYKISQFRLGQAYEYGALGLKIDNRSSIAYYTKAAAQGEHGAELALSGWYLTGADGILEHSDTEAYLWARKAASSEPPLAKAMFAMGYFTENGIGCPASMEDARKWYGRAASYKFPKAIERLEELRKNGNKSSRAAPLNSSLTRKDQKRDEENCVVM